MGSNIARARWRIDVSANTARVHGLRRVREPDLRRPDEAAPKRKGAAKTRGVSAAPIGMDAHCSTHPDTSLN